MHNGNGTAWRAEAASFSLHLCRLENISTPHRRRCRRFTNDEGTKMFNHFDIVVRVSANCESSAFESDESCHQPPVQAAQFMPGFEALHLGISRTGFETSLSLSSETRNDSGGAPSVVRCCSRHGVKKERKLSYKKKLTIVFIKGVLQTRADTQRFFSSFQLPR